MKSGLDVFGRALHSYFTGNKDAALVMHTDGREPYELPVSVFFRPADYYAIDKIGLSLCQGKVLDIGAGCGEHSLYLQEAGLDVTALDISPYACDVMQARGVKSIAQRDIFAGALDTKFDTWLLLGRSIGAVGSASGFLSFLALAYENMTPAGRLVFNSINTGERGPVARKISFEFAGEKGPAVDWLDIDQVSLTSLAEKCGFQADIVHAEEDGNYLAVLRKIAQ